MPDRSFLSWPFFEKSHWEIQEQVLSLIRGNELADRKRASKDMNSSCRVLATSFGHAGLLKHAVPKSLPKRNNDLDIRNPDELRETLDSRFDVRSLCVIRETLAYYDGLWDFVFAMQGLGSAAISLFGSEALRHKYLEKVVQGRSVAAFAISEPDAGSDLHSMQTTAVRSGDYFVIDGKKTWISNADLANFYVTFCRFPAGGDNSYVALVVPDDAPGLFIQPLQVIAPHPIGTLHFNKCRVPASALIGSEGAGLRIALTVLDIFRPSVGAAALGFARRALDEALAFAKERRAFGKSLSELQTIQNKLAEMAVAIDASALLVYRAAWTHDVLWQPVTREAAMAKLHATEAAQHVIDEAVQILGARGVVAGSITEQLYREVRALRIYEGTSEIQKLIIAGQVLKAAGEAHAG